MKKLFVFAAFIVAISLTSCSSTSSVAQSVSSVFPAEEATTLAESMAAKLGLTSGQKSSVYTSLLTYFTQKRDLINQVKNNSMTQAAMSLAESKLSAEKNASIKAVLNSTQLQTVATLFGIK